MNKYFIWFKLLDDNEKLKSAQLISIFKFLLVSGIKISTNGNSYTLFYKSSNNVNEINNILKSFADDKIHLFIVKIGSSSKILEILPNYFIDYKLKVSDACLNFLKEDD